MEAHIKRVCQVSYFQQKTILTVQRVLSPEAPEKLVHAFVTARLDYCNSNLVGISDATVKKLQLLQNSAARLVSKTGRYEHISPAIKALHWLPKRYRIDFRIITLTYNALNELVPSYIRKILQIYHSARTLRSTGSNLLLTARVRFKTFGRRSYHYAAPALRNQLSTKLRNCHSISSFKSILSYQFSITYS